MKTYTFAYLDTRNCMGLLTVTAPNLKAAKAVAAPLLHTRYAKRVYLKRAANVFTRCKMAQE